MIVCICHYVSDRDIEREARQGCASFEALQDETFVATACGACNGCARQTFERACAGASALEHRLPHAQHPHVPHPHPHAPHPQHASAGPSAVTTGRRAARSLRQVPFFVPISAAAA